MNISKAITNLDVLKQQAEITKNASEAIDKPSFKQTLNNALNEVNDLQLNANQSVKRFLNGEIKDVHQVMVAAEKASVGLELTIEVRNKIIEAYREVMRMSG